MCSACWTSTPFRAVCGNAVESQGDPASRKPGLIWCLKSKRGRGPGIRAIISSGTPEFSDGGKLTRRHSDTESNFYNSCRARHIRSRSPFPFDLAKLLRRFYSRECHCRCFVWCPPSRALNRGPAQDFLVLLQLEEEGPLYTFGDWMSHQLRGLEAEDDQPEITLRPGDI